MVVATENWNQIGFVFVITHSYNIAFTHLASVFRFIRCNLMMINPTEDYLILVQNIGQQTNSAVCFQRKFVNRVGILTYFVCLPQQPIYYIKARRSQRSSLVESLIRAAVHVFLRHHRNKFLTLKLLHRTNGWFHVWPLLAHHRYIRLVWRLRLMAACCRSSVSLSLVRLLSVRLFSWSENVIDLAV